MDQRQRQFMQYLRGGNWVKEKTLPDSTFRSKLVALGWIERRGSGSDVEYRITETGLAALRAPIPVRR